jgi:hypothetical protein
MEMRMMKNLPLLMLLLTLEVLSLDVEIPPESGIYIYFTTLESGLEW